jgi:N-acetyl-anhydromuramyl-L-alanine amidase AmpD
MLTVSAQGWVMDPRVRLAIAANIERGPMAHVGCIVVHQTDGATAESAFNSYKRPAALGAHFLIDKDGTIYQTASLFKQTRTLAGSRLDAC